MDGWVGDESLVGLWQGDGEMMFVLLLFLTWLAYYVYEICCLFNTSSLSSFDY